MDQLSDFEIEFRDNGTRHPPILFIPGSYSTSAAWKTVQNAMDGDYRLVGTSLCGYGQTRETRTRKDFSIDHEIRLVEYVSQKINRPFHLVGHSFGGTVSLAAALSRKFDILSIATFEANPLSLLDQFGHKDLYDSSVELAHKFEKACLNGEIDAAALIIDFWGGVDTFQNLPEQVQEFCRTTAPANVLDWYTDLSFDSNIEQYQQMSVPTLLVRGGLANQQMLAMTDILNQNIPQSRLEIIENAGHFLISTHAEECANVLETFYRDIS